MFARLGPEALLMAVALALYLVDAVLFLRRDEAVLLRVGGGRWQARFGLDRWRWGGKEPYLPNPFTPQRPLFRLRWRFEASDTMPPARNPLQVPPALDRFGPHAWVSLLCLFVLLPWTLFVPYGIAFPIAVIAALYLNIALALVRLARCRAAFGLSGGAFATIAFECLACAPFSINLVRRLCARLPVDEDFTRAATRLLAPDERPAFAAACLRRVDEQIDYEPEESARLPALRAGRARFAAANAAGSADE